MVAYRVVVSRADEPVARAAGAEDVEPGIVGNLVVRTPDGEYRWADGVDASARYASLAALVPPTEPLSDPSVPIEQTARALAQLLDLVAALSRTDALVVLGSGAARRIPAGVDPKQGRARFAASLRLARDLGRERGLRVMIEPLAAAETNLITSAEQAAELLDEFDLGDIPIVADLFHLTAAGFDLQAVERIAPRVGHVHLADTGRRAPGTGDWPIADYLTALRRGGYTGDVTIECAWDDLAAQLPASLEFVRAADWQALAAR